MHPTTRPVDPRSPRSVGGADGSPRFRADAPHRPIPTPTGAASPDLAAAAELMDLGFSIVPVHYMHKAPDAGRDWTALRIARDQLARWFPSAKRSNIGIMLGAASVSEHGVLVDVDIDCDELLGAADELLPKTSAVFGRDTRKRSHRLYWCTGDVKTMRWQCPVRGVLAELRADGCQTVGPGSVHPDGTRVRWEEDANGQPAAVPFAALVAALGELTGQGPGQASKGTAPALGSFAQRLARVRSAPRGDRNNTLYMAALRSGSLIGAGRLHERWARAELLRAATEVGLTADEATSTIESGIKAGKASPDGPGHTSPRRGAEEEGAAPGTGSVTSSLTTLPFDQVASQQLRWLWPGVLPLGKLCCICGDPGLGKSFLSVDIAARLSRGEAEFNGGAPGDTLILNAEDDPADTTRARLVAAGAVLSRIHTPHSAGAGEQPGGSLFSLDRVHSLALTLASLPECRLVVIDPVTAYFPDGRDSHKQTDVRRVLAPLADLAQRRGVTIVLIAHLNKDAMAPEVYRVSGSTALPAACRAVWSVWRDPDDANARLFKPIKLNLARDGGVRRYWLAETQTPEGTPRVVWEGASK